MESPPVSSYPLLSALPEGIRNHGRIHGIERISLESEIPPERIDVYRARVLEVVSSSRVSKWVRVALFEKVYSHIGHFFEIIIFNSSKLKKIVEKNLNKNAMIPRYYICMILLCQTFCFVKLPQ